MHVATPQLTRIALLLAAVLAAGFASSVRGEEYVRAFPVTERPTVRVRAGDSNVRVVTSDAKEVQFRVDYSGYTLNKSLFIETRNDGNEFELVERTKDRFTIGISPRRHLEITVHMPREADLSVLTGDGSVEVSAVNGPVNIRSGDGRLEVSQLTGTIDIETHDGAIKADSLKGELRLRTGDGTITARNLDGTCDASSGDGSIRIDGRFDGLNIRSGDGSVVARVESGSRMGASWSIRTGDGPVEVALPSDFKATLEASTGDGRISVDLPVSVRGKVSSSNLHGELNGGGAVLSIRTGDGGIRLGTI